MQVKCTGETAHSPRREPPAARQHGIDRHSTCGRCELQRRHHEIEIEMDGVLNCLGCFLWVDLGTGAAATPGSEAEAAFNAAFDGGEQERTFPSTFPFGDPAFGPSATPEEEQQETVDARCNDFTSLCSRRTLREGRYASNWQNPLLLLPTTTHVRAGDRLLVATAAAANSTRPRYRFEVALVRRGSGTVVPLGRLDISFDDLYPDFGDL